MINQFIQLSRKIKLKLLFSFRTSAQNVLGFSLRATFTLNLFFEITKSIHWKIKTIFIQLGILISWMVWSKRIKGIARSYSLQSEISLDNVVDNNFYFVNLSKANNEKIKNMQYFSNLQVIWRFWHFIVE